MSEMFQLPKIGIVGLGFVGQAIRESISGYNVVTVDSDASKGSDKFEDLFACEGIFICVPSPQSEDGTCDTSILENVLEKLQGYTGVIISKCTAPPDAYKRLNDLYPNLVHVPEFLTAARAKLDYIGGKFAFIGGNVRAYQHEAERIIRITQHSLNKVIYCTIGEAALAKYTINSFLATKVTFMNEIYMLAQNLGLDYEKVAEMVVCDDRIGNSHMQVPGPEGLFGFGGMCFPKDTSALIKFAEQAGVHVNVVDAAVKKNTLLRLTKT
jgi:nucleotide sugar dehydrogenase